MTALVRAFRPEDAEDVAAIRRAAVPHLLCTAEAVAWKAASAPARQRLRLLVAEDGDGRVLGCAEAGLVPDSDEPGHGLLRTAVAPEAQGRGTGRALVAAAEMYLAEIGATVVHTRATGDGRSTAFAERCGYAPSGRSAQFLVLELAHAALPPAGTLPAGVELRTAADFADDLRPLYEADLECTADEPGDVEGGRVPYADWLRDNRDRPDLDHRLTSVALVNGEVAAYSMAQTDGRGRYSSEMTGTRRAYRNRGLARLAKTDSLRHARAAGCARAFTGNDTENAPMLAVNKRLGFAPAATEWRYLRRLEGGSVR